MNDLLKAIAELSRYYIIGCLLMMFFTATRSDLSLSQFTEKINDVKSVAEYASAQKAKLPTQIVHTSASFYLQSEANASRLVDFLTHSPIYVTGWRTFFDPENKALSPHILFKDPILRFSNVMEDTTKKLFNVLELAKDKRYLPTLYSYDYRVLEHTIRSFIKQVQQLNIKDRRNEQVVIVAGTTLETAINGDKGLGLSIKTHKFTLQYHSGTDKPKASKKDELQLRDYRICNPEIKFQALQLADILDEERENRQAAHNKLVYISQLDKAEPEAYNEFLNRPISYLTPQKIEAFEKGGTDIEFFGIHVGVKDFRLMGPIFVLLIGIYFISHLASLLSAIRRMRDGTMGELTLDKARQELKVFPLIITETNFFFFLFSFFTYLVMPCAVVVYLFNRAYCKNFRNLPDCVSDFEGERKWYVAAYLCFFAAALLIGALTIIFSKKINNNLKATGKSAPEAALPGKA